MQCSHRVVLAVLAACALVALTLVATIPSLTSTSARAAAPWTPQGRDTSLSPAAALHQSYKVCMTLEARPARYAGFANNTGVILKDVHKMWAVNGSLVDVANDSRISLETRVRLLHWKYRYTHQEMSHVGALGCSLSHMAAWDAFLATDAQYLLALEDDANFTRRDLDAISRLTHFPAGWHMWVMGGDILHYKKLDETWIHVGEFHHTHALLITREGVEILKAHSIPIEAQIDGYMGFLSALGRLRIIHTFKVAIGTLPSPADIRHSILWVPKDIALATLIVLCVLALLGMLVYFRRWLGWYAIKPYLMRVTLPLYVDNERRVV